MSSYQKGFTPILLLIGIIAIAIIGGTYYFGKTQVFKSQPQNPEVTSRNPKPIFTPQSTSSPDKTAKPDSIGANWKTYRSSKHGFELQYPDDWQVTEDSVSATFSPVNNQDDLVFYVSVYSKEVGGHGAPGPLVRTTDVVIAGFKTQEKIYQGKCCGDDSPISTLTSINLIKHIDKYYSLEFKFNNQNEKSDPSTIKIFNQILSTFKFLPAMEEGKFCGGVAANLPENKCPSGYKCQLDGNYPDAGGKCVKE